MLGSHIIKKFLLMRLLRAKTCIVYSTLIPRHSPDFETLQEVVEWFNRQPHWLQEKFKLYGYFVIYSHKIALKSGLNLYGREVEAGEVLKTQEAKIYDYTSKQWL